MEQRIEFCNHDCATCRYCGLNNEGDTEPYEKAVKELKEIFSNESVGLYRQSLEVCVEFAYGTDDKVVIKTCTFDGSCSRIEKLRDKGYKITQINTSNCKRPGHEFTVYLEKKLDSLSKQVSEDGEQE